MCRREKELRRKEGEKKNVGELFDNITACRCFIGEPKNFNPTDKKTSAEKWNQDPKE